MVYLLVYLISFNLWRVSSNHGAVGAIGLNWTHRKEMRCANVNRSSIPWNFQSQQSTVNGLHIPRSAGRGWFRHSKSFNNNHTIYGT